MSGYTVVQDDNMSLSGRTVPVNEGLGPASSRVHQGPISPTRRVSTLIVSVGGVCLCLLLIEMKKERIQSAWHAYELILRPICWRSLFNQHASNSM